jgi:hypothetical protein
MIGRLNFRNSKPGATIMTARTFAVFVAALAAGFVLSTGAADAQRASAADKAAVKQATRSCKAEAKGKKVPLLQRRKYVKGCLVQALRDRPNVDVNAVMKTISTRELPGSDGDSLF